MARSSLMLCIFSAAACSSATAGGGRPAFERFQHETTPGPQDHPVVGGVVLLDRGTLTFSADRDRGVPVVRLRHYHREKVLRPEVFPGQRVVLPYDPGSAIVGLIAQVIEPEGRRFEIADFAEITAEDGRPAKAFRLPELSAGAVIEYTYDVYFKDPRFLPPWAFQGPLPTVRSEYAVVVPASFEVDLRYFDGGLPAGKPPERFDMPEGTRLSWSVANLPPLFPEPDQPARQRLGPEAHVLFVGATIRGNRISGFRSWDDVRRWFIEERVGRWAELNPDQAAEARRIAGDAPLEERALKLLEVVARDLPWTPGPPAPLWRADAPSARNVLLSRQGNATSRGMLLTALLRAAGIDALPAFYALRDRGALHPDFPVVRSIDGIAAVIARPGGPMVLDPSDLTVSADVPPPRLQGTRIIALREDQTEIMLVPLSSPKDSRSVITYDLRVDGAGSAVGTAEVRLTGAEASALRGLLLPRPPDAYPDLISEFLQARGATIRMEGVSIADLSALRRPLSMKSTVSVPQLLADQGDAAALIVSQLVIAPSPVGGPRRRSPLILGGPRQTELTITLLFPDDHKIDTLPPGIEQQWATGRFQLALRQETPRRVSLRATTEITGLEISVDEHPAYLRARDGITRSLGAEIRANRPPPKRYEY